MANAKEARLARLLHAGRCLDIALDHGVCNEPTFLDGLEDMPALMDRLSRLHGVEAAGGATGMPAVTPQRGTRFEIADRQLPPSEDGALLVAATPDYFRAVRTPVLRGRAFERGAVHVRVIRAARGTGDRRTRVRRR